MSICKHVRYMNIWDSVLIGWDMVSVNIKEGMPPADLAVANLLTEIEYYSKTSERIIKVVHGYGSKGRGGEIKKLLHEKLKELTQKKEILGFVKGEALGSFDELSALAKKLAPELIINPEFNFNGGITIIILNDKENKNGK